MYSLGWHLKQLEKVRGVDGYTIITFPRFFMTISFRLFVDNNWIDISATFDILS
jgi:hypothetical protein